MWLRYLSAFDWFLPSDFLHLVIFFFEFFLVNFFYLLVICYLIFLLFIFIRCHFVYRIHVMCTRLVHLQPGLPD